MKHISILLLLTMLTVACSRQQNADEHALHRQNQKQTTIIKYTCPMHPDIVRDGPGKCPVCGMNLVKRTAGQLDIKLNERQIKLANITIQKVSTQAVDQTVVVNARLTINQNMSQVVSSRMGGRIEKLYLKETGRTIQKGEPLYQIYSEDLLTLQREFLIARDQSDAMGSDMRSKTLYDAAKKKLLLYGLTESQLDKLLQSKSIQNSVTILSPATGLITEISVSEGQYVAEGTTLIKIEKVDSLWLEAELYSTEDNLAKIGDKVSVQIDGFGDEKAEATIDFLSPEYRTNSQIIVMRASLHNPGQKYKPGMQGKVFLKRSSELSLAIPAEAVIRDGNGSHVFVKRGPKTFHPQVVKTGIQGSEKIAINDGLALEDTVVVSGAYLLYSEVIMKNGIQALNEHRD